MTEVMSLRWDRDDLAAIRLACDRFGVSMASFIRRATLDAMDIPGPCRDPVPVVTNTVTTNPAGLVPIRLRAVRAPAIGEETE